MQVGSVSVRFGLILEAYCRGNAGHMRTLIKQMDFLDKMGTAYDRIKHLKDRRLALQEFKEFIKQPHCQEALSNVLNPLNPSIKLNKIMQ